MSEQKYTVFETFAQTRLDKKIKVTIIEYEISKKEIHRYETVLTEKEGWRKNDKKTKLL